MVKEKNVRVPAFSLHIQRLWDTYDPNKRVDQDTKKKEKLAFGIIWKEKKNEEEMGNERVIVWLCLKNENQKRPKKKHSHITPTFLSTTLPRRIDKNGRRAENYLVPQYCTTKLHKLPREPHAQTKEFMHPDFWYHKLPPMKQNESSIFRPPKTVFFTIWGPCSAPGFFHSTTKTFARPRSTTEMDSELRKNQ
jgi:hypothetical protein